MNNVAKNRKTEAHLVSGKLSLDTCKSFASLWICANNKLQTLNTNYVQVHTKIRDSPLKVADNNAPTM